jgi:L-asparagine transporter-like permease
MELKEEELTSEESLRIITEMIHTAKSGLKDNGFFYLLWGWLVFTACISQYVLLYVMNSPYNWIGWAVLMPVGGLISTIYGIRMGKKEKVKTYLDEFMNYVLIAFMVSLFSVLFYMTRNGGQPTLAYPLIMMGLWSVAFHFRRCPALPAAGDRRLHQLGIVDHFDVC